MSNRRGMPRRYKRKVSFTGRRFSLMALASGVTWPNHPKPQSVIGLLPPLKVWVMHRLGRGTKGEGYKGSLRAACSML